MFLCLEVIFFEPQILSCSWWKRSGVSPNTLQVVISQNWGEIEPNRTVPCMVLEAIANNRRKNYPLVTMNLRGSRSGTADQEALPIATEHRKADE
ncbi:hypothetical protein TNCV_4562401 [Trichonephila clavipes]|nr:hypothetical protein TNCV_4562401 [Trichonephila clavipes]